VIVRTVDWHSADSVLLRDAQRREITARYGTPDSEPGPAPTGDDIALFVVAYEDDAITPIGCGGLRPIDDRHGEVKRMFVVPERRGSGAATAVLRELERLARGQLGWERLVLEVRVLLRERPLPLLRAHPRLNAPRVARVLPRIGGASR
jgi:GNAT superfamily N-acetyltransferase